jgi:plastocyanin
MFNRLLLYAFFLLSVHSVLATTWVVSVSNFVFSPANLPGVLVGDTVKWQWQTGDHTTTSLTIPAGAQAWDQVISGSNQTYSYVVTVAGSYHYKCTPHFPGMEGFFTANVIGITPIQGEVPSNFKLEQNYPNPFNPVTDIRFDIPRSAFVKLTVMNLIGQEVEVLTNGQLSAGSYVADWNASNYPSGVYFYRLEAGTYSDTKKMILIK